MYNCPDTFCTSVNSSEAKTKTFSLMMKGKPTQSIEKKKVCHLNFHNLFFSWMACLNNCSDSLNTIIPWMSTEENNGGLALSRKYHLQFIKAPLILLLPRFYFPWLVLHETYHHHQVTRIIITHFTENLIVWIKTFCVFIHPWKGL